jgi:hypothetical protein
MDDKKCKLCNSVLNEAEVRRGYFICYDCVLDQLIESYHHVITVVNNKEEDKPNV